MKRTLIEISLLDFMCFRGRSFQDALERRGGSASKAWPGILHAHRPLRSALIIARLPCQLDAPALRNTQRVQHEILNDALNLRRIAFNE